MCSHGLSRKYFFFYIGWIWTIVVEDLYHLAATTELYNVQSITLVEHVVFTLLSLCFLSVRKLWLHLSKTCNLKAVALGQVLRY